MTLHHCPECQQRFQCLDNWSCVLTGRLLGAKEGEENPRVGAQCTTVWRVGDCSIEKGHRRGTSTTAKTLTQPNQPFNRIQSLKAAHLWDGSENSMGQRWTAKTDGKGHTLWYYSRRGCALCVTTRGRTTAACCTVTPWLTASTMDRASGTLGNLQQQDLQPGGPSDAIPMKPHQLDSLSVHILQQELRPVPEPEETLGAGHWENATLRVQEDLQPAGWPESRASRRKETSASCWRPRFRDCGQNLG